MMRGQAGLSFLDRHLPASLERHVVVLPPGRVRAYEAAEWRGAIVMVERGQIELSWSGSGHHRFGRGDLLWLDGLPLRYLHNRGPEPTVLVAVSRRPNEGYRVRSLRQTRCLVAAGR